MNKNKLNERCRILSKSIIVLSKIYNDKLTTNDQKRFIETFIGAALWYLPQDKSHWDNNISEEALKELQQHKNILKITRDHLYPRKIAARELLTKYIKEIGESEDKLLELYNKLYGRFTLVTQRQNRELIRYQKTEIFKDPYESYKSAGIKLVHKKWNELPHKEKNKNKQFLESL